MAEEKDFNLEKLVIGIISTDEDILIQAQETLSNKYGKIDYESKNMSFDVTDYYEKEMGKNLIKKFISFEKLVDPATLADIKKNTNRIEKDFLNNSKNRKINIDPGLLSLGKFILASCKDGQQRIPLREGIYAEITLRYKDKSFRTWELTYPDFRSEEYISILNEIRIILFKQVNGP